MDSDQPPKSRRFRVLTPKEYEALQLLKASNTQFKYDYIENEDLSVQTSRIIGNHDAATYFGDPEEVVTMNELQDGVKFAEDFDETTQREKVDIYRDDINGQSVDQRGVRHTTMERALRDIPDNDDYNQHTDYDQLDRDTQSDDGDSRWSHLKGDS